MSEVIDATDCLTGNVVVFDRGLRKRACLDTFTRDNKLFVSRAPLSVKYKTMETVAIDENPPAGRTVEVISDSKAYLYDDKGKKTAYLYRVIRAIVKKSREEILFVSNLLKEDAPVFDNSSIIKCKIVRHSI